MSASWAPIVLAAVTSHRVSATSILVFVGFAALAYWAIRRRRGDGPGSPGADDRRNGPRSPGIFERRPQAPPPPPRRDPDAGPP